MKSEKNQEGWPHSAQNKLKEFTLDDFMNEVSSKGSHKKKR